jgi:hypothetical protein
MNLNKKTISIIKRYIANNNTLSNRQLATLIKEKSTLTYSQGTLQNYIAQIKKLGDKVIDTTPGNVTGDEVNYPEDHHKTKIIGEIKVYDKQCKSVSDEKEKQPITPESNTGSFVADVLIDAASRIPYNKPGSIGSAFIKDEPIESKPLTSKDHIRGYLLAYTDKNFSELANMLHSANLCTEYTIGTLRNYISAEAKNIGDTQKRVKSTSSAVLLKETSEEAIKKYTHIKNHEVILVDASSCQASDIQYVVDHVGKEVSTLFSVVAFSENTIVANSKQEKPEVKFKYEPTLGINLLSSITTACYLAASKDMVGYNTNLTIITSGGDNISTELTYEDVRYALDELIHDHKWTVNLIFTGDRSEEGYKLAQWLGIDTSNVTTGYFDPQVATNYMHKRINKLKIEEETSLNYYK